MDDSESNHDIEERVLTVLDRIRPALQMDGGDIELVSITTDNLEIRLIGPYIDNAASATLIKMGIERTLRDNIPTFGNVILLNKF